MTGLTADQVRDWTVRRGLIRPDIPARKRGSEAQFSWQTVLLLRLAAVLRSRFCVELQAHRDLLLDVRNLLEGRSFVALWGEKLAIYDLERCAFVYSLGEMDAGEDAIVLRLDRHLEVLSRGFGLQESVRQLPLFPVSQIGGKEANEGKEMLAKEMQM